MICHFFASGVSVVAKNKKNIINTINNLYSIAIISNVTTVTAKIVAANNFFSLKKKIKKRIKKKQKKIISFKKIYKI